MTALVGRLPAAGVGVDRPPGAGADWSEKFLEAGAAPGSGCLRDAVCDGQSVLVLNELATAAECDALRLAARAIALDRSRRRLPCDETLGAARRADVDAILRRAVGRAEAAAPGLTTALFGEAFDSGVSLARETVDFSPDLCGKQSLRAASIRAG